MKNETKTKNREKQENRGKNKKLEKKHNKIVMKIVEKKAWDRLFVFFASSSSIYFVVQALKMQKMQKPRCRTTTPGQLLLISLLLQSSDNRDYILCCYWYCSYATACNRHEIGVKHILRFVHNRKLVHYFFLLSFDPSPWNKILSSPSA